MPETGPFTGCFPPELRVAASGLDEETAAEVLIVLARAGRVPAAGRDLAHARRYAAGAHVCQLYSSQRQLLDLVIPFIAVGVERGERCLWVLPDGLARAVAERRLSALIPSFSDYARQGGLQLLERAQVYCDEKGRMRPLEGIVEGYLAAERQALLAGFAGLRATGDAGWLASQPGEWASMLRYEGLAARAISGRKITALCTYPERIGEPRLSALTVSHNYVVQ